MSRTFRPQFTFTSGQVDPEVYQRGDLEAYYKSVKKADNCITKLTGGLKRRYGTKFLDYAPIDISAYSLVAGSFTIPNLASGAAADLVDDDRATTVVTSTVTGTDFIVFSYDLGSASTIQYITLRDVLMVGGAATSTNQLRAQISTNGSDWTDIFAGDAVTDASQYYATITTSRDWTFKIAQSARYFRFLSLTAFDSTVSISGVEAYEASTNLDNFRILDFVVRNTDNTDENRIAIFGENFADVFNGSGARVNSFYTGKTAELMEKCDYETDLDGVLMFANADAAPFEMVPEYINSTSPAFYTIQNLDLQNIPKFEFLEDNESDVAWGTLTPTATTGYTTLTASSGTPFSGAEVGWKVQLSPVGKVRITQVVSNTVVKGFVEQKIQDTSAVAAGEWTIESGWEDIISSTRGWPITLCFFNSRLYFGGTKSIPDLIMASTIEDNYDFDVADQTDSDGFWRQLGSKRSSNIYMLQSRNTLEIYCDGSVYIISNDGTITPTNVKTNKVTSVGIKRYTNSEGITDGGALYINNQENSVYWLVYTEDKLSYQAKTVSELSSSLVSSPSSDSYFNVKVWKGDSEFRNNFLSYVDEDYSLVFVSLLLEEKVKAFTKCILKERDSSDDLQNAKVRYICPSSDSYFMLAEFPERGTIEVLLMDSSRYLDGSITATVSSDAVSGLDRFEGMYVDVLLTDSGEYLGSFAVSSGAIDLGETTYDTETVECGSAFFVEIETMPIEDIQNIGSSIGKYKNISEIFMNPDSISNLYINDEIVLDYSNENAITEPFVNRTVYGWSRSQGISLSQEKPLDFSIKNILIKAEVNS